MNVRTLKDNAGAVFSPKVSTDSVYLSGSKTNLTTKLSNIDNSISGKADSFTVSSSENTAAWGKSVTVGTVAGTDLKFVMPANPNSDTKDTAGSTDTSSKIFLIGATSQAANPQTYSDNQVYALNGQLGANTVKVAEKVTLQYNSSTESLDFIFA